MYCVISFSANKNVSCEMFLFAEISRKHLLLLSVCNKLEQLLHIRFGIIKDMIAKLLNAKSFCFR